MTIIAFKEGVMASDSLICQDNKRIGSIKKIFELPNATVGLAGTWQHCITFLAWFKNNADLTNLPKDFHEEKWDFEALVYNKTTKAVELYTNAFTPDIIEADWYAIGMGADFALGAMAAGVSAETAVEIAIIFSIDCGGKVQVVNCIKPKTRVKKK